MHFVDFDDCTNVRFSTDDVPLNDRVANLRDIIGRFLRFDIEPIADHPFRVEVALRTLPGLRIISTCSLGVCAQRTKELTTDGNDCFYLSIMSAGIGVIRHGDKEITLEEGEATLLSAAEPISIVRPEMSRSITVLVPSFTLGLLVANVHDAVMRPIPRGNEALRLLAAYLSFLNQEIALTAPNLRSNAARHVYDLVVLAVGATGEATEAAKDLGVPAGRLRAMKCDIIANLGDAELSIEITAARHGVTPRYVRKLFESEGTTFSEFVLGQRLVHAHRLLTAPSFSDHAIGSIALESGFGDLSYFNRTFRRVYGAAPTEVREQAKYMRHQAQQGADYADYSSAKPRKF
jgi:AraC-like DNA-binding protein